MPITRFGISLEDGLLKSFDRLIEEKGYDNRSEAIRDLIRDCIVRQQWEAGDEDTAGVVSLVYSHEKRELQDDLTDLQHDFHPLIMSSMHIHLDRHNCLEVLVVRGKARLIKSIADRLIGTKGVKHGKLTLATTGKDLR